MIAPLLEPGNDWIESFVSRRYKGIDDELREELISIGYEALIHAADIWEERYNEDGSPRFFVYAQNHVRRFLREHLRNKDLPFYIPQHEYERDDYKRPEVVRIEDIADVYAHREVKIPEEELIEREELREVARAMEALLSPRERFIIGRLNGFLGEATPTFQELGDELGITKQAAHEAYHRALQKLRDALSQNE